jgi:hypothetical protein
MMMIKKIALTTLFVLFAGLLIYGAVNRTRATAERAGEIAAREAVVNDEASLNQGQSFGQGNQGQDSQGRGQGQGQSRGLGGQDLGNLGQGNQGQGQGSQGQGQGRNRQEMPVDPAERITITGDVVQAPAAGVDMILQTADGEVLIGTGPGYLTDQGFVIEMGDEVSVEGFWDNGEFKATEITLLSNGQSIILRDEWGRPMWSGAGRNAQNRQYNQNGV